MNRDALASAFLRQHGFGDASPGPRSADCSYRSYRRLTGGPYPALLMDAPPDKEPLRPFVTVAAHLRHLGLSAPEVPAVDYGQGFALVEDFGDATFTRLLDAGADPRPLYARAVDTLVALQSLTGSFMGPVVALVSLGTSFQQLRSFTERTDDVLQHPLDPAFERPENEVGALPDGRLALDNVSFGYLPLDPPLIENLDLSVKAGNSVALVGGSGSGKSTIGRIIVGLYPPQQGDVLIGGKAMAEWPRTALTNRIAYIDQTITLFEGTVRDNLTLWDQTVPEAEIVRAARDAMIHDVIASRSGAYDAHVDEGGRNFSGGQRQRLEIARALVSNPSIIVMDEATSALDAATEASVMENIRARGATLVIIAHRLSTIRDCDEILVLDRGKPIERGTHEELTALGGAYAALLET